VAGILPDEVGARCPHRHPEFQVTAGGDVERDFHPMGPGFGETKDVMEGTDPIGHADSLAGQREMLREL
jgi:hypothetical protein